MRPLRSMRPLRLVALLSLVLLGCAQSSVETTSSNQTTTPAESGSKSTTPQSSRPAIATLETHGKKVTILGGAKEGEPLRVLVRDRDGVVIADGVTVSELRRTDPELGAIIENATASGGGTYLDATWIRPPSAP